MHTHVHTMQQVIIILDGEMDELGGGKKISYELFIHNILRNMISKRTEMWNSETCDQLE